MIQFEHLTIASADPARVRADYVDLIGLGTDDGPGAGSGSIGLDNIELRFQGALPEAAGVAAVGLVGRVGEQVGRWTLGSPAAASATTREEVPFAADTGAESASHGSAAADPAAIRAVDHIVIRSRDVDATRRLFEQGFGLRVLFDREFPAWKVRLCMCRIGDAVLEIAGSLGAERADEGRAKADGEEEGATVRDRLWGVTWRVGDIQAAHDRLLSSGFGLSEVRTGRRPGTRVFTVRDRTGEVPTLIIQPSS